VLAAAVAVPAALSGTAAPAVPASHMTTAGLDAMVTRQVPRARPLVTRIVSAAAQKSYAVVAGDTLSGIAGQACGNPADWPAIWHGNQAEVPDPDVIYPGQVLTLTCQELAAAVQAPADPAPAPAAAVVTGASGVLSTAGMSAFEQCVIARESGGNAAAVNPASDAGGLFQFLPSTWAGLGFAAQYPGGAQTAPVSVQEAAFAAAYAQSGTADWHAYDGC